MKLNNRKNILLCNKALYAEQLHCYASLCECYEALADHLGKNATSEDVQKRYAPYLTLASKGDLSFLDKENNYIISENYQGAKFQNSEAKIFKRYANQVKKLYQFKTGASILAQSINNDGLPSQDVINNYQEYMRKTSSVTRKFDKEISEHSPTYIGHSYYLNTKQAISTIRNIDSTHLDGLPVSMEFAPSQFGADISGTITITELMNYIQQGSRFMDTKEERIEYSKKPNPITETGYKFLAKNSKGAALSLAAIVALGTITGVGSQIKKAHDYNNLSVDTLNENDYESDLSEETINSIHNIEKLINEAQNQDTIPNKDQLYKIGTSIDNIFDDILQEKIEPSFLEAHPDAKDIKIEHQYDYENSQDLHKSITITYTDANGLSQNENITRFNSVNLLANNDLDKVFDKEYNTDQSYDKISNIFSANGSKTYIDNSKDVKELLDEYSDTLDFIKHLAVIHLDYKDGSLMGIISSSIKSDFPEEKEATETTDINEKDLDYDDAR